MTTTEKTRLSKIHTLFLGLASLLILVLVPVAHAQNCSCPEGVCFQQCHGLGREGWVRFRDSCYLFNDHVAYRESLAWHACFISGGGSGRLLEIDDKEEDDFVRSYANCLFEYPTNMNATFWTGGVGHSTNYSNWFYKKQPHPVHSKRPFSSKPDFVFNVFNHYCMALVGELGFKWKSVRCQEPHHTICEARQMTAKFSMLELQNAPMGASCNASMMY